MLRKWILATALTLAFAVGARADFQTTQITLVAPFGGDANVSALVNKAAGLGAGLSYTTSTGLVGSPVTAVQATQLGTFKLFNGTQGTFQTAAIVEIAALQGVVIPPVSGAAFSAQFTKGVAVVVALPTNTFNASNVGTWGFVGPYQYSATVVNPPQATVKGPLGDQDFAGQPITGQNQGSFFVASGHSSLDALLVKTLTNPGTLFAPPQPFDGFQIESTETNALTAPYNQATHPTDTQLDTVFSTLAALAPGQGLVTGQFAANLYAETANPNGPNTLQEIGFTQYPVAAIAAIPEPASIVLLSLGAIGVGFYARRQRKGVPV